MLQHLDALDHWRTLPIKQQPQWYDAEAVAAAASAEPSGSLSLGVYRCLRDGTGLHVLVEPLGPAGPRAPGEAAETAMPEPFRTRLTDFDLDLGAEDASELERVASRIGASR